MNLPVRRVVLYKHGIGYFEREGTVEGDASLSLTFKQAEVSDVLKSLTVLDLDGGHVASVSYDSTKPLEQLLAEVALSIPDEGSLIGLLPQLKGARIAVVAPGAMQAEGILLGIDSTKSHSAEGVIERRLVSLLADDGNILQFDLHSLLRLTILDATIRRDLDYYLRTQLSAMKKETRTFTFFARGEGKRRIVLSYTLAAPVWKATYRILLGKETEPPQIQGWAVIDNTQDEDWEGVELSLIAGLPVSFIHDLYTPRYLQRPVVQVQESTGVLPPEVESGMALMEAYQDISSEPTAATVQRLFAETPRSETVQSRQVVEASRKASRAKASSTPAQIRERKLGDLFEYQIEHPVTIRRNQSALVPIVLRAFEGKPVLLHNRLTRPQNPMRCVEFKNTTGLTLEGGPVTVLESGSYVGEAMLETTKPDDRRLLPFAVELSVQVLDNVESYNDKVTRVVICEGRLTEWSNRVQVTTYHFDNKSDQSQILYLDQPREASWSLTDTPAPVETTDNYWRFRFDLPARRVTTFTVKQQQPTHQVQVLTGMSPDKLAVWLEQKHVDAATEQVLRQVLAAQQQLAEAETQLTRLEQERGRIAKEQDRIRQNLQSLGDRSSEKELRERFVRTLNSQEDRLEAIAKEFASRSAEKEAAQARVNQLVSKLEFDNRK